LKTLILLLIFGFLGLTGYGQHGGIYGEWYLIYYEVDGTSFPISAVEPPIGPSLTIGNGLEISGIAACNTYSGNFSFDAINDVLVVANFEATADPCQFQTHIDFEADYFNMFNTGTSFEYAIIYETNGTESLLLSLPNGDELFYHPYPLVLTSMDSELGMFHIYPNPVSDVLKIASEGVVITSVSIYSISGQVLCEVMKSATGKIDVSQLSEGIYFITIDSESGRHVQQFIKR
jgi:heat shock protein HslJ